MVVGITGGFCSGKSLASAVFREHGYRIVDVDRVGYEALDAKRGEVVEAFGRGVLIDVMPGSADAGSSERAENTVPETDARFGVPRGSIDREKLGRLVFSDRSLRKKLEAIVHPWMIKRVREYLKEGGKTVIDAALLIEMCLFSLCDVVIGIDVDEEVAVKRGMERNRLSREEVLQRLRAQIPLKQKSHFVDTIIGNNGMKSGFCEQVRALIEHLEKKV